MPPRVSGLPQPRIDIGPTRMPGISCIGRLDTDKGASTGGPIAALGHFDSKFRTQPVELLENQVEPGVSQRLQYILALHPKGLAVIPRRPAPVLSIAVCAFVAELGEPAPRQALIFAEIG